MFCTMTDLASTSAIVKFKADADGLFLASRKLEHRAVATESGPIAVDLVAEVGKRAGKPRRLERSETIFVACKPLLGDSILGNSAENDRNMPALGHIHLFLFIRKHPCSAFFFF